MTESNIGKTNGLPESKPADSTQVGGTIASVRRSLTTEQALAQLREVFEPGRSKPYDYIGKPDARNTI